MQLLTTLHDSGEAHGLVDRMRNRGVALYVQTSSYRQHDAPCLVYVCIDRQYQDAVRLLSDPDYEPTNPVDVEAVLAATQPEGLRVLARWTFILAMAAVILVSAIVWLIRSNTAQR